MNKNSFNGNYYNRFKTPETVKAVRRVGKRDKTLTRASWSEVPLRGFGNKYRRNSQVAYRLYQELVEMVLTSISSLDISEEGKSILHEFEEFQSRQKGPVFPIPPNAWSDQVVASFLGGQENPLILESSRELEQVFLSLFEHFRLNHVNFDASSINFMEQWKRLPSSTTRGFKYNTIGKKVDHLIIKEAGSSGDDCLVYFKGAPQNTSFTGVRLQGTPGTTEAKVRLVSMSDVRYHYINNGLYYNFQQYLMKFASFSAGLDGVERDKIIVQAIKSAKDIDCVLIPMDYSKFDRCCNRLLRSYTYLGTKTFYSSTPRIDEGYEQQLNYSDNQFLIFEINGKMTPVRVDNLLLSGVPDTQLTGSLINLAIQGGLQTKLGSPINGDLNMALGDDVLMPIKQELIDKWTYKGLLSKISELLEIIGFETNVDKAYPSPIPIFLQRIYYLEDDIIGHGSYCRTLASGMFKENFAELPEGIRSLMALELFAQIVMISDIERHKIIFKDFREKLAHFGLEKDDGLRAIIGATYNSELDEVSNADSMVRYLIKLVTEDLDTLLKYFGSHSYDRYNLGSLLSRPNYGMVFNFTVELIRAWGRINYQYDAVKDIFSIDISNIDRHDSTDDFVKIS